MGSWDGFRLSDRRALERHADWLAIAVAASLPWSTSATSILVPIWLLVLLPTLDIASVRREILSPAGGFPVLLVALGVLGVAWADVAWAERLHGFKSFLKLLTVPILMAQFRRSEKGPWVLGAFFLSSVVLLLVSYASLLVQSSLQTLNWGVPVKSYIVQSIEFAICGFIAAHVALNAAKSGRSALATALLLLALVFLGNIFFVATGRTALVILVVLLCLFGIRHFGWKGAVSTLLAGVVLAAALWTISPYLRDRVSAAWMEVERYREQGVETSAGFRLEFWKKSVHIIAQAPLVGHGTGTISEQFRRLAVGATGMAAVVTANPHNQILTVGIQLGFVGIAVLVAMWAAHLVMFWAGGTAAWIGTVVVAQNIVGSLFNSHLFDFTEGWIYVFLAGVAGGLVRKPDSERLFRRTKAAEPLGA